MINHSGPAVIRQGFLYLTFTADFYNLLSEFYDNLAESEGYGFRGNLLREICRFSSTGFASLR